MDFRKLISGFGLCRARMRSRGAARVLNVNFVVAVSCTVRGCIIGKAYVSIITICRMCRGLVLYRLHILHVMINNM